MFIIVEIASVVKFSPPENFFCANSLAINGERYINNFQGVSRSILADDVYRNCRFFFLDIAYYPNSHNR